MKKWLPVTLIMASVIALGLFGGAMVPSAEAVTCVRYECDNKSPVATGCSAGATTVKASVEIAWSSTAYRLGWVQLRYSPTCKTVWTKVILDCDLAWRPATTWQRVIREHDDGSSVSNKYGVKIDDHHVPCDSSSYGYMLFVPDNPNFRVRGLGEIQVEMGGHYGSRYTGWWKR